MPESKVNLPPRRSIDEFDPSKDGTAAHEAWPELVDMFAKPEVKGVLVYVVQDMSSSHLGDRKAVVYGPTMTAKSAEDCLTLYPRLDTELVSTAKWPECYIEKDDFPEGEGDAEVSNEGAGGD